MELTKIAEVLKEAQEKIILIYAFNGIGKTRLSVAYKDITKNAAAKHTGVYYNAYSEDLFQWDNDENHKEDPENANTDMKLTVIKSSLNELHSYLIEDTLNNEAGITIYNRIQNKLNRYNPYYTFKVNQYKIITAEGKYTQEDNIEEGISSFSFFAKEDIHQITPIKISRGEERLFIWSLFCALFEDAWSESKHIFIDDPVSSLDEHNIYVTADSIFDIIEQNYKNKKIIITTHHIGLFSILADRLYKGAKSDRYKSISKIYTLTKNKEEINLSDSGDTFLFHLHLIKTLGELNKKDILQYHFVLLRELLENISSFLGVGKYSYLLSQIGITDIEGTINMINSKSHKDAFRNEYYKPSPEEVDVFVNILDKVQKKYNFKY